MSKEISEKDHRILESEGTSDIILLNLLFSVCVPKNKRTEVTVKDT